MKWPEALAFKGSLDGLFRMLFVIIAGGILVMYSMVFEAEYSDKLIDLFLKPWWRILVVVLLIAAGIWCPRVGILVALVVFFYLSDMETLVSPLGTPVQN
jgi:ethanolamine transporter EutH